MVEDDAELHLVIASPPSVFDAAVLLRTLYSALGPSGWRANIIGLGGKQLHRLVVESRVPVSVIRGSVSLEAPEELAQPVYIVDNRGEPAWRLEKPSTIVVDYSGFYARGLEGRAKRVRGAQLPSQTYEAVTLIYEFFVRRRDWRPMGEAVSVDPRSGLYLARKVLEALRVFDNYLLLEPNTVVYTLRRVYMRNALLLDPERYEAEIDPVSGRVRERILVKAYTRRGLREKGLVEAVFDGSTLIVRDWGGERFRITIDPYHRVACAAPGLCASAEKTPGQAEPVPPQQEETE